MIYISEHLKSTGSEDMTIAGLIAGYTLFSLHAVETVISSRELLFMTDTFYPVSLFITKALFMRLRW